MSSPDVVKRGPQARMVWVDGLRGLAVVVMVWVHVANTLLTPQEQSSEWYVQWTFFHGLVAPAFFWIGGFVRGVRVLNEGSKRPGFGAVKRLFGVMALGYAMHFPWGVLIGWNGEGNAWKGMVKVDVLQTLAFTGLVMVGVERLVRTRQMQQWVIGALLVVFVMLEQWSGGWVTGWSFLDAWLSRETGSIFCLFPWVGFGLAGWLCGTWATSERRGIGWIGFGVGLVLAWGVPRFEWLGSGEAFFLQRLGWVILVALVVAGLFRLLHGRVGWISGGLLLAGRESLAMYVVHLTLIHAIPFPVETLEKGFGKTQSVEQVVGWFVLVAGMSWMVAWWNERRKMRSKDP